MPFVREASHRFGIAEDWIKAVMRMESGGQTQSADGAPIISKAGAMGLMQLMPETWRDMQQAYGLGANPFDPHDNVIAGTAYLRKLYEKFGFPAMFAAYNAGPATVDEHSAGLRELPRETRDYVRGIARMLGRYSVPPGTAPASNARPDNMTLAIAKTPESGDATFTRPDGVPVQIAAAQVTGVRVPLDGEFAPGVQTVLSLGGLRRQGVLENAATVTAELRSHGARI